MWLKFFLSWHVYLYIIYIIYVYVFRYIVIKTCLVKDHCLFLFQNLQVKTFKCSCFFSYVLVKMVKKVSHISPSTFDHFAGYIYIYIYIYIYKSNIFLWSTKLDVVDSFVYLSITFSKDGSFDAVINLRIEKPNKAFIPLKSWVWSDRNIPIKTILGVKKCMFYVSFSVEIWTSYQNILRESKT